MQFCNECTGDRTLSAPKRIKNELRFNMEQNRMIAFSLLRMENDIVENLQSDDMTDDFARQKSRNMQVTVI